jgi:polyhydroxyalkanoate synthase
LVPERIRHFWNTGLLAANNLIDALIYDPDLTQTGATPYQLIAEKGLMTVRYYLPLEAGSVQINNQSVLVRKQPHAVPLVFIPPLGARSTIFDLMPSRSLVRFFLARGFKVYLIDWGAPERSHAHLQVRDYVTDWMPYALEAIRKHARCEDLSLYGYCFGGLLALMYTAWSRDKHIRNIVSVAAPIDMHDIGLAGNALQHINKLTEVVGQLANLAPRRMPGFSTPNVPGTILSLAFQMTNPLGSIKSYWDLMVNIADREYVSRHTAMRQWFNRMHAYPGGVTRNMLTRFGVRNELVRDKLRLARRDVRLGNIQSSLLCVAGQDDVITTRKSAEILMDKVGSKDKTFILAPGGHAGVFAGLNASNHTWPSAEYWLSRRSRRKG